MKTKRLSKNVVTAIVAGLVIMSAIIYLAKLDHKDFEQTVVSQTQQQLLTIAKSTARSLEKFVQEHLEVLRILSRNPSFQEKLYRKILHDRPDIAYCPLESFYEIYQDDVDALTTLDANGIMLHRHPFIANRAGMDYSDKPGVAYVLREHESNVSEVFYNNLGNPAISISEPVFYKGEFAGIVRWMIQLDTIHERFIQPIKVGKKGYVQVSDSRGMLLCCPNAEHVGRHVMAPKEEAFPDHDWSDLKDIVKKMTKDEKGVGVYYSAWWTEKELKLVKKLSAYAPVRIGNTLWSIRVTMWYDEIADPINRNARHTFWLAGFVMLVFGAGGVGFFKTREKKIRLETEARFAQAQKMGAVGRLAGGIAHDFNNLLQTINGYSAVVLQGLGDSDPLREDIEEILNAGREAAALTGQLLEFSRKEKSQVISVDLKAVIVGKVEMLRRLIGEDIKIVTKLSDRLSLVRGDPGHIRQVIMNLVVNAYDAMPEGGTLTITTENVTLDLAQCKLIPGVRPGTFVCLSISDTGAGMEETELDRIFEPFYTTKGPGEGTGLGLSTVYGIIQQYNGFIRVSSDPGKGTAFNVYLPIFSKERKDETRDSISPAEVGGNGERVLLVEDEKRVRKFVTKVLRENGYIPFPASSGTEALTIFEKEDGRFHLVLSDVILPDTNGPKLVDQLLARKPDLRIILTSGYAGRKAQRSLIEERGYVFLQKPYELADLLKTMREVLGMHN